MQNGSEFSVSAWYKDQEASTDRQVCLGWQLAPGKGPAKSVTKQ